MKISKLFHWLYAFVMLLPVFAIGVTCGYAMFNKNAYQSYSGNNTIQTNYLTNINDFELNNTYYFNSRNYTDLTNVTATTNQERIYLDNVYVISSYLSNDFDIENTRSVGFYKLSNTNILIYLYDNDNNLITSMQSNQNYINFSFNYLSNTLNNNSLFEYTNMFYSISNLQGHYIDNVFYYSVNKVTQSNLFNWAYDSFLVAPFSYIVGLFSMPTNSPVVMLLSYWLAISIIWLVFDLVMYVPLLVHRWLDKGVLE